jgi:hypothetical protein
VQNNGAATTVGPPCKSEPTSPDTNIWVKNPSTWNPQGLPSDFIDPLTGQLITAPSICWAASSCPSDPNNPEGGWYSVASPGPLHPCDPATVSGNPPVFDNDTTWGPDEGRPGGSVPSISVNPVTQQSYTTNPFNLTPPTSYTCKTSEGELSWNAGTRTLTASGTIFIDGSVTATWNSNGQPITYNTPCTTLPAKPCDGVIYVTGTVFINSEQLCGKVSGNSCDWANWDPNQNLLIFLANYYGTQQGVSSNPQQGIVVNPSGTAFQGALFANYQIFTGQSATTQGPLVSRTQTVVTGQSFQGSFPKINILPLSVESPPGNFWIDPAMNFG